MKLPFPGYYPAIALDRTGVVHVVFEYRVSDKAIYAVFYTRYANGVWSPPIRLSREPYAEVPNIDVTPNGQQVVVTYQSKTPTGVDMYVVESTNGGLNWHGLGETKNLQYE